MKTIWKWTLQPEMLKNGELTIDMPRGAAVLTVQLQHGEPQLWALVDPQQKTESRRFLICGTGHPIPDGPRGYVGTFQISGGVLVFHVFEVNICAKICAKPPCGPA